MRRNQMFINTIMAAIWVATIFLPAIVKADDKSDEILLKTIVKYNKILSYQGKITISNLAGGAIGNSENSLIVYFKKPNMLMVKNELKQNLLIKTLTFLVPQNNMDIVTICDAKNIYAYSPASNKYVSDIAPKNFKSFMLTMGNLKKFGAFNLGFYMLSFLQGESPESLKQFYNSSEFKGEENLDGSKCYHISFETKAENSNANLWIDAETYFIRKRTFKMGQDIDNEEKYYGYKK